MQQSIDGLRESIFTQVYQVYEIFQNFFGEEFTDLQGFPDNTELLNTMMAYRVEVTEHEGVYEISEEQWNSIENVYARRKPVIMVWWPRVTVTNENDRSVQIQDLYAKIQVTLDGRIPYEFRGFQLTRTTFPESQFTSGYIHSHIPHFSGIPNFRDPCLGSGPINNTIMDLKNGYEEALWMLFCQELALYVTVESLRGGPYFRLETIGSRHKLPDYRDYVTVDSVKSFSSLWVRSHVDENCFYEKLKIFTKYYLEHGHLSFNYRDGRFVPGMPYFDFIIDISNSFIDFYNSHSSRLIDDVEKLYDAGILKKAFAANNEFYDNSNMDVHSDFSSYEGHPVLIFKGETKTLHIEREEEVHMEVTTLLHHNMAMYILSSILKIINYRYRNEHTTNTGRASEDSSSSYQTVIYL